MEGEDHKKVHRQRQAGPKAVKKKAKKNHQQDLTPQQRNPKAFSIQHAKKTAKIVQRSQDIKTKKHHIPLVDRTSLEPPPIVVAIVGPPKVGKSTLFQCIVKNYAKQRLANIQGPVTVVAGKNRRLTIIECNNDINAMIDVAKVADLVLLLVDASFGFEMETFEFLNICQVHGFPRIMGVLTHLDSFRDNKKMRKTKKRLKHRFWTEVYQGAKLFYLSGMVNGEYQKTEVHNLCRFISVMKFRPLQWRITHPYVVADRMEDITDPELLRTKPKSDRTVSIYGYVRGTHMKNHITVHIPGCGDFSINDMHFLSDPCPTPDREKRRSLSEKERMIYAPMSGVGGIVYDKDAVYIDLGGSHSHKQTEETSAPINELVASLMSVSNPLDQKMTSSHVTMFSGTAPITEADVDEYDSGCPDDDDEKKPHRLGRRPVEFNDSTPFSDDTEVVHSDGKQPKKKLKTEEKLMFADSDDEDDADIQLFSQSLTMSDGKSEKKPQNNKNDHSDEDSENDSESSDEVSDDEDDEIEDEQLSKIDEESDECDDDDSEDDDFELDERDSEHVVNKSKKKLPNSSLLTPGKILPDKEKVISKNKTPVTGNKTAQVKQSGKMEENSDDSDDDIADKDSSEMDVDSDDEVTFPGFHSKSILTPVNKNSSAGANLTSHSHHKKEIKSSNKQESDVESDESMDDSDEGKSDENDDDSSEEENDDEWNDNSDDSEGEENANGLDENNDDSSEESDEETGMLKWKSNLTTTAAEAHKKRQGERINYRKLIYGKDAEKEEEESEDELGGLFKVLKQKSEQSDRMATNCTDCSKFSVHKIKDWAVEEIQDLIKDCFVTGEWDKSEDAAKRLQQDDELYGDFEDLETGEVHEAESDSTGDQSEDEDDDKAPEEVRKKTKAEMTATERREEKKRKLKEAFNAQYDVKDDSEFYDTWKAETELQAKLNRAEFESMEDDVRVNYEGFRPGMYVRIEIEAIPCEFVTNFDATYPVILGGLSNLEENVGFVQTRLKKHRWHKRILKTKNPLIISLGWRRFQSLPLYSIQDHNMRNRLLKYTPEHLHCNAVFYGPITPQNTGLLAVESVSEVSPGFRIAATGVVLELDKSMQIVKKLKLTGTPNKIYKKTAFIQGMFNSALEVTKFEGAKITTVSGIRGMIKKAIKTPEGAFRATFEDKILLSDIVFLRTWYPVQIPEFYNPLTNLLLPKSEKNKWVGMKTLGQLRREKGLSAPFSADSQYKPVERKIRHMTPLTIPRELQKMLPFKDTPKILQAKSDPLKRVAVIRGPKEAKVAKVMKMLKTLHEHKRKTDRFKMRERAQEHEKKMKKVDDRREKKHKEVKKNIYRALGQLEKKKQKYSNKD